MTSGDPPGAPLIGEPLPVELMNTIWADRDGVYDALTTPAEAWRWLVDVSPRLSASAAGFHPLDAPPRPDTLAAVAIRLRGLRDALRRLAAEQTGDDRAAAQSPVTTRDGALDVLSDACASAPSWSGLQWPEKSFPRRVVRSKREPAHVAVSLLAELGTTLFSEESRTRLRACMAPGCVLYFVKEHPRRAWCSTGCGNRARVARHYQRHRNTAASRPRDAQAPVRQQ